MKNVPPSHLPPSLHHQRSSSFHTPDSCPPSPSLSNTWSRSSGSRSLCDTCRWRQRWWERSEQRSGNSIRLFWNPDQALCQHRVLRILYKSRDFNQHYQLVWVLPCQLVFSLSIVYLAIWIILLATLTCNFNCSRSCSRSFSWRSTFWFLKIFFFRSCK